MIMATLLSFAGYLFYFLCMMALSCLVILAFADSPSFDNLPEFIQFWIILIIPFTLKNFQWDVLISESHYTLPSSVSQLIALLLCLTGYLVCVMIWPVLLRTCALVWSAALGQDRNKDQLPDWIQIIMAAVTFVVTDCVTSYYVDPALISEFLSNTLRFLIYMVSPAVYLGYIVCMVTLSLLMLAVAFAAIENTKTWWPELIHTSIVGLALLLLNIMWGSPFQKPSADADTRAALAGIAGYLVYIVSSMVLSYNLFGATLLLKTFVISLTFTLLDVFVKPSSIPDMIAALGTIAGALMAFFFLVAMSFLVFMFLHTWVEILLPSACLERPAVTFSSVVGLAFVVMKGMFDVMLAVEEPSVFSDVKAGLIGIAQTINGYHGAHVVIRNLTVLAVPLLSISSRRGAPMYGKAALIVTLGLLLTMPPPPGTPTIEMPAFTLVSDDFVQQTITKFVTSQIQSTDGGEIKLLTDS